LLITPPTRSHQVSTRRHCGCSVSVDPGWKAELMQGFVFDLDGTLVDSVYQHVLAWREALDAEGIELSGPGPPFSPDTAGRALGHRHQRGENHGALRHRVAGRAGRRAGDDSGRGAAGQAGPRRVPRRG